MQKKIDCPANLAIDLISGKWCLHILMPLMHSDAPMRFGELQRMVHGISQRELTKRLREFENSGIISRKVFPQVPPRVEYRLTPLGRSLEEPLQALHHWAAKYGPKLKKAD